MRNTQYIICKLLGGLKRRMAHQAHPQLQNSEMAVVPGSSGKCHKSLCGQQLCCSGVLHSHRDALAVPQFDAL